MRGGGGIGVLYRDGGYLVGIEARATQMKVVSRYEFSDLDDISNDYYTKFGAKCSGIYDFSLLAGITIEDRAKLFLRMGLAIGRFRFDRSVTIVENYDSRELFVNSMNYSWVACAPVLGVGIRFSRDTDVRGAVDFGIEYSLATFGKKTYCGSFNSGSYSSGTTSMLSGSFRPCAIHMVMLTASYRMCLKK